MSGEHTPGPWAIREPYTRTVVTEDDRTITVTNLHGVAGDEAEAVANARIIAAAPDMLAALRWARGCVPYPSECHSAVVAAIRKAVGTDT